MPNCDPQFCFWNTHLRDNGVTRYDKKAPCSCSAPACIARLLLAVGRLVICARATARPPALFVACVPAVQRASALFRHFPKRVLATPCRSEDDYWFFIHHTMRKYSV